jgi:hypothetical protein
MLILRHVDPHECPRLFKLHEGLTTGIRRFTLRAMKVTRDLLCELGFAYTGASKEEHNEGTVRINPSTLTQADGRRDGTNRTLLSDDLVSDDLLDINYENL